MKELFMNELHAWLSSQHPGLKTFKILQHKLSQLAADQPEQRAMCRLLHGIVGNYIEEFDEAPLPSALAERAYRRMLGALAELDGSADPAHQLGNLNRLAALDLTE
jgi:RecB family exonuclease